MNQNQNKITSLQSKEQSTSIKQQNQSNKEQTQLNQVQKYIILKGQSPQKLCSIISQIQDKRYAKKHIFTPFQIEQYFQHFLLRQSTADEEKHVFRYINKINYVYFHVTCLRRRPILKDIAHIQFNKLIQLKVYCNRTFNVELLTWIKFQNIKCLNFTKNYIRNWHTLTKSNWKNIDQIIITSVKSGYLDIEQFSRIKLPSKIKFIIFSDSLSNHIPFYPQGFVSDLVKIQKSQNIKQTIYTSPILSSKHHAVLLQQFPHIQSVQQNFKWTQQWCQRNKDKY